jgi:hypothetical protein
MSGDGMGDTGCVEAQVRQFGVGTSGSFPQP